MRQIFDFSGIEESENTIRQTWAEFRNALATGVFAYNEIDKARKYTFLRAYDDLFRRHSGISHQTVTIKELNCLVVGRGTILGEIEILDYGRFIPKKEFIKNDNRFSPAGVEWLYLAIGNEYDIHQCAQVECRAKTGDRFGFCHFAFGDEFLNLKLVDLTVADDISYDKLNANLEEYGQRQAKMLKYGKKCTVNKEEFKSIVTEWIVYTYTRLLSEQIFEPLCEMGDKNIMYAPFQTMAQYYISLGYSGIIYGSTVSDVGRNLVLFNKNVAHPTGTIEDYIVQ